MLSHPLLLHVECVAMSPTHNTYMLCYDMTCKRISLAAVRRRNRNWNMGARKEDGCVNVCVYVQMCEGVQKKDEKRQWFLKDLEA